MSVVLLAKSKRFRLVELDLDRSVQSRIGGEHAGPIDGGKWPGELWDVTVISSGLSANGAYFSEKLLKQSAKMFEGTSVNLYKFAGEMFDHLPDPVKAKFPTGIFGNLVGALESVRFGESHIDGRPAIRARLRIMRRDVSELLIRVWESNPQLMPGLSIDVQALFEKQRRRFGAGVGQAIHKITRVSSTDIVSSPAAGAGFARLVASITGGEMRAKLLKIAESHSCAEAAALLEGDGDLSTEDAARAVSKMVSEFEPGNLAESNMTRVLLMLKEILKGGRVGEAVTILDKIIGGTAFSPVADSQAPTVDVVTQALLEGCKSAIEGGHKDAALKLLTEHFTPDADDGNQEDPNMAEITTAANLQSVYPVFVAEIVKAAVAEVQDDSKRTAEVDELKASVDAKAKEIEDLNAKHAGELKTVSEAQEALKKKLDDLTASTTKNEQSALGDRLIQSSKLGPILASKNKKYAEAAVGDEFIERVRCSVDQAAAQTLIDERVNLLNLTKGGIAPPSSIDTDKGDGNDAGVEERRGAFSSMFGNQPSSKAADLKALAVAAKEQTEAINKLLSAQG